MQAQARAEQPAPLNDNNDDNNIIISTYSYNNSKRSSNDTNSNSRTGRASRKGTKWGQHYWGHCELHVF